jgi:NIMA (never in mitosis gene a)-related kinase 1/4/5
MCISHPNITGYKESFIDEPTSTLCLVVEYSDNGDFLSKIQDHAKKGTFFKESDIWIYFLQMVIGLKALHDLKICHRDIKCANIFLSLNQEVKLGDFNVSKVAKKGSMLYTQTGTPYYASPEVWKDKPYDYKSDIWSLGCVLYEIVTLRPPFKAFDMKGLYKKVVSVDYPPVPSRYSSELQNIIKAMLQSNPSARPSCEQILQMTSIFKNIKENSSNLQIIEAIKKSFEKGQDHPRNPYSDESSYLEGALLGTIKLPRVLK